MKTVTIIGATGNMGSSISKSLSKGTYNLQLVANDSAKLSELVQTIKTETPSALVTIADIQQHAETDIYILALPYQKELKVAEAIKDVARGKIVISISNPLNETFSGLVTAADTSAGQEIQKLLPDSKVIKAFNTNYSSNFSQPVIDGKAVDSFIAGNDEEALKTVAELVGSVGFSPIVAGGLEVSHTLENMQFLLIQLTMKYGYNWVAGWKVLHN